MPKKGDFARRRTGGSRTALFAVAILALVFANCPPKPEPDAVDRLAELPEELAADLTVSRSGAFLVSRPAPPDPPDPPPDPAAPLSQFCTQTFFGFVTYPVVVCSYPDTVFEELLSSGPPPADEVLPTAAIESGGGTEIAFFKLTSHRGSPLTRSFFCSVHRGPWGAEMRRQDVCDHPAVDRFDLLIAGLPEPMLFTWFGTLADAPPELGGLDKLNETGPPFCDCCFPRVKCGDLCIPPNQECMGQQPT